MPGTIRDSGSEFSDGDQSAREDLFSDEEPTRRSGAESGEEKDAPKKKRATAKKKTGPVIRQMLSEEHLTGKNGLIKLEEIFKHFKFRGKGYEKQDLDLMLHKYEHWCHTMHPKFPFAQVLERIEFLGMKKRPVKTMIKKIRMGLVSSNSYGDDPGDEGQLQEVESDDDQEHTPRDNVARGNNVEGSHDDWQDIPDDDDDLFASIDVGAGDVLSVNNIQQDSSHSQESSSAGAGGLGVVEHVNKKSNNSKDDSGSDGELVSKRKANKSARIASSESESDSGLVAKRNVNKSARIPSSDSESDSGLIPKRNTNTSSRKSSSESGNNELRHHTGGNSVNKSQKGSQKLISSDDDEDDLLLATNSQKEVKSQTKRADDTPLVLKSNNKQNKSTNLSPASSKRKLPVTESDSEDEGLLNSARNKQVKPKQKRGASVKLPKVVISPLKSKPVKRRRVARLDDDEDGDSRSSASNKPNISSSEESANDSDTNANVTTKKRRVLDSSDDDEDMALLNTSKEKSSQRRRIVSDSEED